MDYEVRPFTKDQLINLRQLYISVYTRNSFNLMGFEARFACPKIWGEVLGFLAYPRSRIFQDEIEVPAAYYGVFPQFAVFEGDRVLCAQSGDTMTHPLHRGRGLFTKLANLTNDLASERDIEFIFGFPSKMSLPGFREKLGWTFPYRMLEFNRFVPTLPVGILKRVLKMSFRDTRFLDFLRHYLAGFNHDTVLGYGASSVAEHPSILRDSIYLRFKLNCPEFKFCFSAENGCVLLKYDGEIKIGDFFGEFTREQLGQVFRKIDLLAFLCGSPRVRTFFSPLSIYRERLSNYGRIKYSMPYGYLNLSGRYNPENLDLRFIDFDYF